MSDWEVFQRDVLDVLRQYEGFFDFFERVGSLSDDSRPDCFARISREDKKEIWVIDAKNKPEFNDGDLDRMEKYVEMLKSNPIDVGLEMTELSDYTFRGVFVTSSESTELEKFETVNFNAFHQFLQKELVYTNTDKVVRDVSKMVERKQLSQSQARLLFRSLKPFEERIDYATDALEDLEDKFQGLEVKRPPLSEFDFDLPVDAVVTHSSRDMAFLFDIPYSWEAVKEVDEKVEEVKNCLSEIDREVFYAAINTFEPYDSEFVMPPEEVEREIMETAGLIPMEKIVGIFTPKVRTEIEELEKGVAVKDTHGFDFRLEIRSKDDINHRIEARIPEEGISRMKETMMNSRKEFGELSKRKFSQQITVTSELEIEHDGSTESFEAYKDSVKNIFQSSVNPVLSKKVKKVNETV